LSLNEGITLNSTLFLEIPMLRSVLWGAALVGVLGLGGCLVQEDPAAKSTSPEQKARQELANVKLDSGKIQTYSQGLEASSDAQVALGAPDQIDAAGVLTLLEQKLGTECTKALLAVQTQQFALDKAWLICEDKFKALGLDTAVAVDGTLGWSNGSSGIGIVEPGDGVLVDPIDGMMCPEIWDPVCGVVDPNVVGPNGETTLMAAMPQTFSSECHLKRAGAKFLSKGECPKDSLIVDPVDPTEPGDSWACPMIWAPVCGVDAKCAELQASGAKIACQEQTYSNTCVLEKTGGKFVREGECNASVDGITLQKGAP
jgi:hypothetical protein